MKKLYVFVLLMFSFNSFSQFFDDELDFLVFDVQDSLIIKQKVKSLLITERKLTPKLNKEEELLKYNKQGYLKSYTNTQLFQIDKAFYKYNNDYTLQTKRQTYSIRKNTNQRTGMVFHNCRPSFNKKNEINLITITDTNKTTCPDFYSYEYDSLKRVKKLKGCKDDLCEFVVYGYFKDTIKIKRFDKSNNIIEEKQIIENKLSKEITSKRFNDGFSTKLMMNYSLDSLVLNKNYWNSDKGLYKKEIIYFNSKNNIKKKIIISINSNYKNSELQDKNIRNVDLFYYKDNRLIEIKKTFQGSKITQKIEYLDNGLLDKVIELRGDRKEIKKYAYKYY